MDSILVADSVSKSFGSLRAVDDVSFSVAQGEIFGIAGPNGSGKSTLFNIVTSIPFPADAGRVVFEGKDIQRMRANRICRSGLARTFQKETAFDTLSTLDNVILGSTYGRGTDDSAESRRQASETLEFVGIGADQFERPAAELSVFDKKRLMIASAIVTEPRLLLLDEPASGLTKPEIDETIDLIRRLNERGVTLLVIEHVLPLLLTVSARLLVLNHGSELVTGTPDDVIRDPLVVEAYLGVPGTPWVMARYRQLMAEPILDVRALSVGYGKTQVLWDISLTVPEDQRIGLFGPNGHGKTTLLRTISGLLRPWSGEVHLRGERIDKALPRAIVDRGVVQVPQGNVLFPELTVAENLRLGAYCRRARPRLADNLARVYGLFPRLKERRRQQAKTLSGGERQMLAIGAGLMGEPTMLMLDEPTLGLAPKLKDELLQAIAEISRSGVPLMLVEQDLEFLLALTDRLYMINHGVVALDLDASEGFDHDQIIQMYFGKE